MISLCDELLERIRQDPRVTKRGGARQDLGLLLFSRREELNELWKAAEREVLNPSAEARAELGAALGRLKALFGERA